MVVSVRLVGSLRGVSGKDRLTLRFGHSVSLRTLVNRAVERLPKLRPVLIDPVSDEPTGNVLVVVNGREASVLDGLETVVNDGDEVVLVPVVHGG